METEYATCSLLNIYRTVKILKETFPIYLDYFFLIRATVKRLLNGVIIIVICAAFSTAESYNVSFSFYPRTTHSLTAAVSPDQKDVVSKSDKANGDLKRIHYAVDLISGELQ